jgi:DNA (cytosine-5)-methyltransferase 1
MNDLIKKLHKKMIENDIFLEDLENFQMETFDKEKYRPITNGQYWFLKKKILSNKKISMVIDYFKSLKQPSAALYDIGSDISQTFQLNNLKSGFKYKHSIDKEFKMIDLFAGIGGIRSGFEQTNQVKSIFSCEIDKDACEVYEDNFGDDPYGDITKIDIETIPDHDIICGGIPCQAFSIAGKQGGFEDTRGTLFRNVAEIVKEKQPKAIFLENVKGLVSHDKGKTLKTIISAFEEIGYIVHWSVLNAVDFGIPQKRQRIYIVAFRKDIVGADKFSFPTGNTAATTISSILEKNVDAKYFLSQQYCNTLKDHKERHKKKGNGFGYQIISADETANTIMVGGMGRERNLVIDQSIPINLNKRKTPMNSENIRKMTPREWARLQGIPEDFKLSSVDGHSYAQLGNCVVVPVIRQIAEAILEKLNNG